MNKWSEKQTMIATVATFAVLILGFGGASFWMYSSKLQPARKLKLEKEAALQQEKMSFGKIKQLEDQLAEMKKKQAEFKEKLPTAAEVKMEEFRKTLSNYATASNVVITGIRPSTAPIQVGAAQAKPFDEISFNVDVKGSFATLGNFVYMIETHRRLIKVEALEMKPDSTTAKPGEELPKVVPASLTLKLTTYQFK